MSKNKRKYSLIGSGEQEDDFSQRDKDLNEMFSHLHGINIPINTKRAKIICERYAKQGLLIAKAISHMHGWGEYELNKKMAVDLFLKIISNKDNNNNEWKNRQIFGYCYYYIAKLLPYLSDEFINEEQLNCSLCYEKSKEYNCPMAYLESGFFNQLNELEHQSWASFISAAMFGSTEALYCLAMNQLRKVSSSARGEIKNVVLRAISMFEHAAQLGSINSLIALARFYAKGLIVEPNITKSIEYYKKANELITLNDNPKDDYLFSIAYKELIEDNQLVWEPKNHFFWPLKYKYNTDEEILTLLLISKHKKDSKFIYIQLIFSKLVAIKVIKEFFHATYKDRKKKENNN